MTNYKEIIINESLGLTFEQSTPHIICPFCGGGDTKENSFIITRKTDGLVYNCFRAKCKKAGFIPSNKSSPDYQTTNKIFTPKLFTKPLYKLDGKQTDFLKEKFLFTDEEINNNGIKYSKNDNRFYYPIFSIRGREVGAVCRTYDNRKPKTLTYWFEDAPRISFPIGVSKGECCVLVEDIPSSIRVNRINTCGALLGTGFSSERAVYLSRHFQRIIFAFDPDATALSIGYVKKYSLLFESMVVAQLTKDPKDMTDEEILEEIFNGKTPAECHSAFENSV